MSYQPSVFRAWPYYWLFVCSILFGGSPVLVASKHSSAVSMSSSSNNPSGTRLIVHHMIEHQTNQHHQDNHNQASPVVSGSYRHRQALFGQQPQGVSLVQPLYYVDSDFCNLETVSEDVYHPTNPTRNSRTSPFLLLVNRGGCNFVQKVRNAQHFGAAGALIADNLCVCGDTACTKNSGELACQPREPVLANDGSGNDITIPSFLVFKQDATRLKHAIVQANQTLQVEMSFPPGPTTTTNQEQQQVQEEEEVAVVPRIELDVWLTPTDVVSQTFLQEFRNVLQAFAPTNSNSNKSRIQFNWHAYLMDGVFYGCHSVPGPHCTDLCTNYGRYCATSQDPSSSSTAMAEELLLTGSNVVAESLRQLCLTQPETAEAAVGTTLKSKRPWLGQEHGELWWAYVTEFSQTCLGMSSSLSSSLSHDGLLRSHSNMDLTACVEHVYRKLGIDGSVINRCMYETGGLVDNRPNALLEAELQLQKDHSIYALPTVYLNQMPLQGPVTASHVLGAVCDAWQTALDGPHGSKTTTTATSSSPEGQLCAKCRYCPDWKTCLETGGHCPTAMLTTSIQNEDGGLSILAFVSSLCLMVIMVTLMAVIVARREQQSRRQHVRDLVADYMLLTDDDEEPNDKERGPQRSDKQQELPQDTTKHQFLQTAALTRV